MNFDIFELSLEVASILNIPTMDLNLGIPSEESGTYYYYIIVNALEKCRGAQAELVFEGENGNWKCPLTMCPLDQGILSAWDKSAIEKGYAVIVPRKYIENQVGTVVCVQFILKKG